MMLGQKKPEKEEVKKKVGVQNLRILGLKQSGPVTLEWSEVE